MHNQHHDKEDAPRAARRGSHGQRVRAAARARKRLDPPGEPSRRPVFLAGDSLRGRLTEHGRKPRGRRLHQDRASSGWGWSRPARIILFQPYNLMTATPADGNALDIASRRRVDGASRARPGVLSAPLQRERPRGAAPLAFVGFGISAPHLRYDDYNGDVKGKIVLALDHEPGERDPNSPFDGVVTSESSTPGARRWRRRRRAPPAVLFVSRRPQPSGAGELRGGRAQLWPEKPPRILPTCWPPGRIASAFPSAQISPALAASLVAGTGRTLDGAGAVRPRRRTGSRRSRCRAAR